MASAVATLYDALVEGLNALGTLKKLDAFKGQFTSKMSDSLPAFEDLKNDSKSNSLHIQKTKDAWRTWKTPEARHNSKTSRSHDQLSLGPWQIQNMTSVLDRERDISQFG